MDDVMLDRSPVRNSESSFDSISSTWSGDFNGVCSDLSYTTVKVNSRTRGQIGLGSSRDAIEALHATLERWNWQ